MTLTQVTPEIQRGFVTLSQIPHTGFPTGSAGFALFWTVLIVWSGVFAYFVVVRGWGRAWFEAVTEQVTEHTSAYNEIDEYRVNQWYREREDDSDSARVVSERSYTMPMADAPLAREHEQITEDTLPEEAAEYETDVANSSALKNSIEEHAHMAGVLFSDEALNYLSRDDEASAMHKLEEVIARARGVYPREDGWIHLNRERVLGLLGGNSNTSAEPRASAEMPVTDAPRATDAPHADASHAPTPDVPANLPTQTSSVAASTPRAAASSNRRATEFIGWLCAGDTDQAFNCVRNLHNEGRSTKDFLGDVLCELDDTYQNRLEGRRQAHAATLEQTKRLSQEEVERVIEYLLSGIDSSYSKPHVGVKMALLQALSFTNKKQ